MLTYMSHSSDLSYIMIGKNQAKLNSEWTWNGNTDLPVEGDLHSSHTDQGEVLVWISNHSEEHYCRLSAE